MTERKKTTTGTIADRMAKRAAAVEADDAPGAPTTVAADPTPAPPTEPTVRPAIVMLESEANAMHDVLQTLTITLNRRRRHVSASELVRALVHLYVNDPDVRARTDEEIGSERWFRPRGRTAQKLKRDAAGS